MKFNKNQLQNDQLLHDLHREAWADDVIKALRRTKITTYNQLFVFLGDNSKNPQLRADICEEISRLFVWIDRRRFVSPLLKALKPTTNHYSKMQSKRLAILRVSWRFRSS